MKINLSSIRIDGGTQPRAEINESAVADYAEAYKAGEQLPPVTLFFDGADYWLADGFHRYHGARTAGKTAIDAVERQGTRRDAVLYSVSVNATHGLRRTDADKRKAVTTLLEDPEWTQWSDHEIARQCVVAHSFVAKVRRSLDSESSEDVESKQVVAKKATQKRKVKTKHGTVSTMETSGITDANKARKVEPTPPALAVVATQDDPESDLLADYEAEVAENAKLREALASTDFGKQLADEIKARRQVEQRLQDTMAQREIDGAELKKFGKWFAELRKITGTNSEVAVIRWCKAMAATQRPAA